MCGVVGVVDFGYRRVDQSEIARMASAVKHRGPDSHGIYIHQNLGLGHRRLSILDLSDAARQPMESDSGRFVLSYNGEIYNFRELRNELAGRGVVFNSNSDTEVLLRALEAWGPKVIARLNGMFAFALFDRTKSELLLARDRYGIKPLYWAVDNDRLIFASELKAICAVDEQQRDIDPLALSEYFSFQNILSDRTLLAGIRMFPAGHYATINTRETKAAPKMAQYWDFDFQNAEQEAPLSDYTEELRRLVVQSINRQLVSDVEVGTYLSGGIDSGTITAIASSEIENLKSFTCGFDMKSVSGLELAFDERSTAEEISAMFRTEHYEMVLKSGDLKRCMTDLSWHIEEPRVGQSYPNFFASKLAGSFVKVVLAGTGGDEIFGGYPWRYFHADETSSFEMFGEGSFHYWQRLQSPTERNRLLAPLGCTEGDEHVREVFFSVLRKQPFTNCDLESQLRTSLYLESKTFLQGLLAVEDKLSMAHGLEARLPFLDNDLVDFALKLPTNLRVRMSSPLDHSAPPKGDDFNKKTVSREGKILLREVAKGFLPSHIASAPKQGFSAPDATWFRGESIDFVRAKLLTPTAKLSHFLETRVVKELVGKHVSGERNLRLLIWSLLSFEGFLDHYT